PVALIRSKRKFPKSPGSSHHAASVHRLLADHEILKGALYDRRCLDADETAASFDPASVFAR
ncbi:MAG TPA: hypothetical protein VGL53_16810, partial [Bryobacteraceae bacterium]